MEVKDLIKSRRIELNMTMKDLATRVGVSEATISRWESGEISNMKRSAIFSLSKILNISPSQLLGMEDDTEDSYYVDPEVAQLAEQFKTNPEMKMLFDATKDISKEAMQQTYDYVKFLKAKEKGEV